MNFRHILTVSLMLTFQNALGAKILVLLPFTGRSHYLGLQPIVKELANRGHDLTVIAAYEDKNANYRQLVVEKKMLWEVLGTKADMFALETMSFKDTIDLVWRGTKFTTEVAFNDTSVKRFIKEDNSKFDLILTEIFYQESMYMFAHKYKAPLVGLCTMGFTQFIGNMMGNPVVPSYMVHEMLTFGYPLNFFQRLKNLHDTVIDMIWRHTYLLPMHQEMAERNFGHLPQPLPKLTELEKNFSLILINTHYSYDTVRPYVPGIVEIGGVHIKKPNPLPEDIQKFLDDATEGAIFFSLGSNMQSKDMSKEKAQTLMSAFKKLKQRVLWKWEDEKLEGKPDNVMIGKWLPQNDILAHPNVKVFITHGGLLSAQEAMYHGVPVVSFPFYGDQHLNADRMELAGFGKKLKFLTVTEEILNSALNELIYNPKYRNTAKSLSERFKDRPMTPLDTAIFWIEYTIRHKGAEFIRSPALEMSVLTYYMLDILLLLLLPVLLVLLALRKIVKIFIGNAKDKTGTNDKKYR